MSCEQPETCSWMNSDYFESILTKYEGHGNLQLLDYSASVPAKGENFASAIYRVKLNYLLNEVPKETTLIFKRKTESSALSEMLDSMGTFEGETHVYMKILTECEKLAPSFKIAPR
jgi:Ecdysteroid kinase-like family